MNLLFGKCCLSPGSRTYSRRQFSMIEAAREGKRQFWVATWNLTQNHIVHCTYIRPPLHDIESDILCGGLREKVVPDLCTGLPP
jgi:hypothetical protein